MGKELRKKLRARPTVPEVRFWRLIHPLRTQGWHFRKQVQLGNHYVDLACLQAGLVVEIDGDRHGAELAFRNDATRDQYLQERGFFVLRSSNEDVLANPEGVYQLLAAALEGRQSNLRASPPPQPSSQGGGCQIESGALSRSIPPFSERD